MSDRYYDLFGSLDQSALNRADKAQLRDQNLALILRKVWTETETTRASLSRDTGLSRSSVSSLVDHLLEIGLFEERGAGVSTGGRKPTRLRFNDQSGSILGVDIGASHIAAIVIDLQGQRLAWRQELCPVRDEPQLAIESLRSLISTTLEEAHVSESELLGVGVGVPSPISPLHPHSLSPIFMPAWRGVDLIEALGLPQDLCVIIENDANLGALAEMWWGAGQGSHHLAFIKLGTGVGAGFIIEGKVFRGHGGSAGELGHMVIDPEGPRCVCGLQGCLVTFIGSQPLLSRAESLGISHQDLSSLLHALRDGDPDARSVIAEAASRLGLAVASLMNMLNPERVILGGELASAGDALLHPLRSSVQSRSLWSAISNSDIVVSALGEEVIALGAATAILQRALTTPSDLFKGWRS